jgi:magnesium-transporting ATPase (P-type)
MAVAWRLADEPLTELRPDAIGPAAFLGLVGIFDPPRPEAMTSIAACHSAGIAVKMITGDHPATARIIGHELGILQKEGDASVRTGSELAAMAQPDLERLAPTTKIFARVAPEHKLRLVRALQQQGEVVAMTGDGVNDAPALKQADIGIAMGRGGTAAAREAADIVLVDDNFATITSAVEEGRRCYDNLVKVTMFLLPGNLAQSVIIVVCVVLFPVAGALTVLPIIPVQILWVNLVTGVMLGISMAFEPAEPDVMNRPPRGRDERVYDARMVLRFLHLSTLMIHGGLGLFWWVYYGGLALGGAEDELLRRAQTIVVTVMVMTQVFYLFECRSARKTAFAVDWRSNPSVYACAALVVLLHIAFVYAPPFHHLFQTAPLTWADWLAALAVSALVFPIEAIEKMALQPRR